MVKTDQQVIAKEKEPRNKELRKGGGREVWELGIEEEESFWYWNLDGPEKAAK